MASGWSAHPIDHTIFSPPTPQAIAGESTLDRHWQLAARTPCNDYRWPLVRVTIACTAERGWFRILESTIARPKPCHERSRRLRVSTLPRMGNFLNGMPGPDHHPSGPSFWQFAAAGGSGRSASRGCFDCAMVGCRIGIGIYLLEFNQIN
jgi:hypothetical protein